MVRLSAALALQAGQDGPMCPTLPQPWMPWDALSGRPRAGPGGEAGRAVAPRGRVQRGNVRAFPRPRRAWRRAARAAHRACRAALCRAGRGGARHGAARGAVVGAWRRGGRGPRGRGRPGQPGAAGVRGPGRRRSRRGAARGRGGCQPRRRQVHLVCRQPMSLLFLATMQCCLTWSAQGIGSGSVAVEWALLVTFTCVLTSAAPLLSQHTAHTGVCMFSRLAPQPGALAALKAGSAQSAMYDPFTADFSLPLPPAAAAPAPGAPPAEADPARKRARTSRWGRPIAADLESGLGHAGDKGAACLGGGAASSDTTNTSKSSSSAGLGAAPPWHGGENGSADGPIPGLAPGPVPGLGRAPACAAAPPVARAPPGPPAVDQPHAGPASGRPAAADASLAADGRVSDAVAALQDAMAAQQDPAPARAAGAAGAPGPELTFDLGPELRAAWGLPHPADASAQRAPAQSHGGGSGEGSSGGAPAAEPVGARAGAEPGATAGGGGGAPPPAAADAASARLRCRTGSSAGAAPAGRLGPARSGGGRRACGAEPCRMGRAARRVSRRVRRGARPDARAAGLGSARAPWRVRGPLRACAAGRAARQRLGRLCAAARAVRGHVRGCVRQWRRARAGVAARRTRAAGRVARSGAATRAAAPSGAAAAADAAAADAGTQRLGAGAAGGRAGGGERDGGRRRSPAREPWRPG